MSIGSGELIRLVDGKYLMNDIAFEKLMEGFNCGETTRKALRLIYVSRNKDRQAVIRQTGVKEGTLSKAILRFDHWIEEYQAANGVKRKDYLVSGPLELLFDMAEHESLTGQASSLDDVLQTLIDKRRLDQ